jgi:hypothetical protein
MGATGRRASGRSLTPGNGGEDRTRVTDAKGAAPPIELAAPRDHV